MCVRMYLCICVGVCVCAYVFVYVCVRICVCSVCRHGGQHITYLSGGVADRSTPGHP